MGEVVHRIFELAAMALDTLPLLGRVLLFAFLLSVAFKLFVRFIRQSSSRSMHILYRKGALLMLCVLPLLLALLNVQTPVHVSEVRAFVTPIPAWIAYAVFGLWLVGCVPGGRRLLKRLRTSRALIAGMPALDAQAARNLVSRLSHWQRRLSLSGDIRMALNGGQVAWHEGYTLLLPSAALNWPAGLVDTVLLLQLAQLKQANWRWLMFGEVMRIVYWPAPWVAGLVDELVARLPDASMQLARAAYREPEGWRRDLKHLESRYATLAAPAAAHFSLPVPDLAEHLIADANERGQTKSGMTPGPGEEPEVFHSKWQQTKLKRALKHFDPYERAYWLIAAATMIVGVATTMTVVREPPEFEPGFLEVEWRDQMGRRLTDQEAHQEQPRPGAAVTDQ